MQQNSYDVRTTFDAYILAFKQKQDPMGKQGKNRKSYEENDDSFMNVI